MPSSTAIWRKGCGCEIGHTLESYIGCSVSIDSQINRKINVNGVRASNDNVHNSMTVIMESLDDSAL